MISTLLLSLAMVGQCPGGVCPRPAYVARQAYAAPAFAPTYYLDDASGVRWTHADPAFLRAWVARQNAAKARPAAPAPTRSKVALRVSSVSKAFENGTYLDRVCLNVAEIEDSGRLYFVSTLDIAVTHFNRMVGRNQGQGPPRVGEVFDLAITPR
jgi:hypothetical protein